ncbi:monovalent cation/H+ antiporter subunit D family protein [Methylonatrum kenyense]|uniref:proton-conducting transporter transmembrane domain-containing protein n=1 Tax=Methylonatrum kenyense TaxID=455253 RepID=UPI0020C06CF6|nr:proton-conducting transporter membrane subunit [Methylonatrum kenyense]MCK8517067.1 monovalent cation/H+ antiporter subunit D family protein [Methylonatrum kenyense]
MPLWVLLSSLLAAAVIFALGEGRPRLRIGINLAAALIKLVLVGIMLLGVRAGHEFIVRLPLMPGIDLVLQADALSMLFISLSALLWLATTIYAIAYLEDSPNRARFFGFFSLCVAATMGIATAGNLFTFFIFYEMLTLATWPLVIHRGTQQAMRAGRGYLCYTLGGGAVLLLGIVLLHGLAGPQDFVAGGTLVERGESHPLVLTLIFALLITGMGVKAALAPLHGWLPTAMVAPAPVSALLHAVAVVKAGAFGIVRVVYDVYGIELTQALGMAEVLAIAASVTIIYGSLRAIWQTDLKRRLAYSTVSQVSYIALGVALANPLASIGGLVHLVHQGLMKITLFFCAGCYAETHGIHSIDELDGIGRRMPWTTAMFTLGALGMIGLPPLAGFISKWYLGLGAVAAGQLWVIGVLLASTVLNAIYFLPILHRAWFRPPKQADDSLAEAPVGLLGPTLFAGFAALAVGLFAGSGWSPLAWVELLVQREYSP